MSMRGRSAILARTLARQGAVVVEPWLDRVVDLSVQLDVRDDGARVLGVTRFFADRRGQYAGHVVGRFDADLEPDARRLLGERRDGAPSGLDVLLATAREQGLGAIAVTDHNEVSGALDARAKADGFGVKVIVGEEVMTADQGEVIGLFIEERIPRGLTLAETIAEIRRQGGLVYVPHPFDRLHTVPDYEHLLDVVDDVDVLEVFNPRIAIPAFNEEAARFAAKYRIVGGAGSDAHVAQGLGSVRIRMRDFDGPDEFLASLRDADILGRPSSLVYVQVQALKFLQTRATPAGAREAARRRKVARALGGRRKA